MNFLLVPNSMTLNGRNTTLSYTAYFPELAVLKVTILFNVKYFRKWYKTELYLQWQTYRKSYMIYQMCHFQ